MGPSVKVNSQQMPVDAPGFLQHLVRTSPQSEPSLQGAGTARAAVARRAMERRNLVAYMMMAETTLRYDVEGCMCELVDEILKRMAASMSVYIIVETPVATMRQSTTSRIHL